MPNIRAHVTALLVAGGILCAFAAEAAAREYPYCAMRGGRGASETCGYVTLAQCRATVSGGGGYCQQNPRHFAHEPGIAPRVSQRPRYRPY